MNSKTTLVVMAAGMGSRFGGLKQIAPVGPNGEIILDFSVYDAAKAGFDKTVFIIRRDIEKDFREIAGKRIEKMIDVDYVFQDMDDLPKGFSVPDGRTKPWGTGHAVYCTRNTVDTPFALINADDYYGQKSYKILHDNLVANNENCMVGFSLGNTITENGTVSRGVCEVSDGFLTGVVEHTALDKNSGIPLDTIVSMNMWGLLPSVFDDIASDFVKFLENLDNPLKGEFFIPFVVDNMIKSKGEKVRVLETDEKWYGVTYKEDKETVVEAMKKLVKDGYYDGI
ncbi:MAG: nucleotidyltransferase [Ruminococcaceae bacterium]|nr:nucleotidyltransferase [Oscillospiraceae bacterium]